MPLKALRIRPGVFRENTRYASEDRGWYFCEKVRFRSGQPEKIGGWQQVSNNQFLGVCRSLWPWTNFIGVGTNLKYYIYFGTYDDITPIRRVTTPGTISLSVTAGSNIMTVTDNNHGCFTGDFVTFSGATGFGGNVTPAVIDQEYQVTVIDANTYTVVLPVVADVADEIYLDLDFITDTYDEWDTTETVVGTYQINTGNDIQVATVGWGSGGWGSGGWGGSGSGAAQIGIWTAYNFGDDLIINPKGGGIYYWDASAGTAVRAVNISTLTGASDTPSKANFVVVSDASRFVLAFGTTDYGAVNLDPMLIRWSDQETAANWTPAAITQAGSLRLSHGSAIEAVAQVRQEILVWTDTSLYSLQYLGPPIVWGSQILADNVSIVSDRAWATAAGVTYWMGYEKFYMFDGRVQTLDCDIRQFIFNDFNYSQPLQVFSSTVEQFSEIWWFYCSANSTTVDKYVVYNYTEKIWYYGTMARTAWVDASVVADVPIAADYNNRLNFQETGCDDASTVSPQPIESYITSAEVDIDDGHNFGFVWRVLPDITFTGSTTVSPAQPSVELSLLTLQNSGSGYTRGVDPVATEASNMSVAGSNAFPVARVATTTVERFTEQVNIRIRARQMAIKVGSTGLGVQWQLGVPRIDVRQDGRKS
jgi:hypothetical protein